MLVELFRRRPSLAAELLVGMFGVELPAYGQVRLEPGDCVDLAPTEYRADAVVLLSDDSGPERAVVVEVQLRRNDDKQWTWPVYLATLRARLRCGATLLVVCVDQTTARWAATVPAVMQLLGRANWYLPAWLRWLPRLHLEASDPGPARVAEPSPPELDRQPDLITVDRLLDPAPLIFGQVSDGGGAPVPGATVTLTDLAGRQLGRQWADSGGHYRLIPPTGGSYLVICASAAHQPTAALVAVARVPVRNNVILSATGASLTGVVSLVESGQPAADAVVTLIDGAGDVVCTAVTDPSGRFSLIELAQGHYTLTVAAASLRPVTRKVEIPAGGHVTVRVKVAARVQLAGVVRTAIGGMPVPEALATLIAADRQVVGSVMTDARGGFRFEDLTAGTYTVVATGYPPVAAEVNIGVGAPNETVITLWPPTHPLAATSGNGAVNETHMATSLSPGGDHPGAG